MGAEDEDELTPAAKAEITAAVRTLRTDGVHLHKTYPGFLKQQEARQQEAKPGEDKPTEGEPPPVKDDKPEDKPKPRRGLGLWTKE